MHFTKVVVSEQDICGFGGDLLFFCAAQAEKGAIDCDDRVRPLLDPIVARGDFAAKENETAVIYPGAADGDTGFSARRLLVVGLGKLGEARSEGQLREVYRSAGGTVSKMCEKLKIQDCMVVPDGTESKLPAKSVAESLCEGILLGDYRFVKYKKEDLENPGYKGLATLGFAVQTKVRAVRKAIRRATEGAMAVYSARDMANEPGNGWTAGHFAEHAEKLARKYGLKCRILDKAKMKRLKMGGMLAVNQGSAEPPKLVILEHQPAKKTCTVLLVGKGLTFDSGGISIKPAEGMKDMKYDMCGGATVLAAMQAIAAEGLPVHVVAMVPATDNVLGSSALKPGDVIRHYNGITSEIISTDAEGRLILADAIAYGIEQYSPDLVVDVATLTGAVIIGLGHHHTGILGNDDALVQELIAAGRTCAEPLWRLPLGKEYTKQIESQVADIKNTGGRPGGTITAAAYIEKFVGKTPWAHLDIAGTAWEFTEKSYIPKGPSGIMVRTLVEFVRGKC
jgi:leucyl aminopeptidase